MAPSMDPSDFVDADYESARRTAAAGGGHAPSGLVTKAPTREELDAQGADVQSELARLKQAQEQLERERAAIEETKRRQAEWKTGREEIIHGVMRATGLLEEAEFSARQDAEQMAKTIAGLRDAMAKVQAVMEDSWTKDNFQVEMTKALTVLENARMEWNNARLKFPLLNAQAGDAVLLTKKLDNPMGVSLAGLGFWQLSRLGLALTWPVVLGFVALVMALLLRAAK